jgi:hypothetical protein
MVVAIPASFALYCAPMRTWHAASLALLVSLAASAAVSAPRRRHPPVADSVPDAGTPAAPTTAPLDHPMAGMVFLSRQGNEFAFHRVNPDGTETTLASRLHIVEAVFHDFPPRALAAANAVLFQSLNPRAWTLWQLVRLSGGLQEPIPVANDTCYGFLGTALDRLVFAGPSPLCVGKDTAYAETDRTLVVPQFSAGDANVQILWIDGSHVGSPIAMAAGSRVVIDGGSLIVRTPADVVLVSAADGSTRKLMPADACGQDVLFDPATGILARPCGDGKPVFALGLAAGASPTPVTVYTPQESAKHTASGLYQPILTGDLLFDRVPGGTEIYIAHHLDGRDASAPLVPQWHVEGEIRTAVIDGVPFARSLEWACAGPHGAVKRITCASLPGAKTPIVSPDGSRFLASTGGWDTSWPRDHGSLVVGSLQSGAGPMLVKPVTPDAKGADATPRDAVWLGNDLVLFWRNGSQDPPRAKGSGLYVTRADGRLADAWHAVSGAPPVDGILRARAEDMTIVIQQVAQTANRVGAHTAGWIRFGTDPLAPVSLTPYPLPPGSAGAEFLVPE